eukprot:CAMPEP_0172196674 /NCGR_PEP_ID=MMETSP1050-20130122/26967_1 /TAXON_ID=233186 /ORGANISM="Cryptomonas curvata, Strain CCAP979/52" /LENGTH=158 /DNA_ID=CAMNT_0012873019 /DNA_START=175 /DNA_END=648 /DNA_ORIENTATION=-
MSDKGTDNEGKPRESDSESREASFVGKAAWISAELLGNLASAFQGGDSKPPKIQNILTDSFLSRDEALERLKREYERSYFISGEMDIDLYTEDCLFADPFASFRGRERFRRNLANLGLLVSAADTRLLSLDVAPPPRRRAGRRRPGRREQGHGEAGAG